MPLRQVPTTSVNIASYCASSTGTKYSSAVVVKGGAFFGTFTMKRFMNLHSCAEHENADLRHAGMDCRYLGSQGRVRKHPCNLDSSTPCWNDVIRRFCLNYPHPAPDIFKGSREAVNGAAAHSQFEAQNPQQSGMRQFKVQNPQTRIVSFGSYFRDSKLIPVQLVSNFSSC
jgi:hypothetical protein